ncbi:urotensin II-related peptide isoform 2-T2 [Menidia menidia]
MFPGAAAALLVLVLLGMPVDPAPAHTGFAKPADPGLTQSPAAPPEARDPARRWPPGPRTARPDRGSRRTTAGRAQTDTGKRAKMQQMISALEELHRTFSSTLSSQITVMSRAGGRNPGRKGKSPPGADREVRPTTATLLDSTASRATSEVLGPNLAGRNQRKSPPSQNKKTNKRVCFWKYCSQN